VLVVEKLGEKLDAGATQFRWTRRISDLTAGTLPMWREKTTGILCGCEPRGFHWAGDDVGRGRPRKPGAMGQREIRRRRYSLRSC